MGKSMKIKSLYTAQFTSLFKRDIIATFQQRKIFYLLRMCIPIVCMMILYLRPFTKVQKPFTGIPQQYALDELKIPQCFALASANDKIGLGAILTNVKCKAITYSPVNDYTTGIMQKVAGISDLPLEQLQGVDSLESVTANNMTTFFHVNFTSPAFSGGAFNNADFLKNFSILVTHNETYSDMPEFWHMYNKQQLNNDVFMDFMVMEIRGSTSLPMALQAHVVNEILKQNGVDKNFTFRSTPYRSSVNIAVQPIRLLSTTFIMVCVVSQFIFCCIQLQQDKSMGSLDALRLAGVQDFIYIFEFFAFQIFIYLLASINQFVIMFFLPEGNDIYKFTNPIPILAIMFVGGLYSTTLAIFVASFSHPKTITTYIIVIFALMLGGLLCFGFLGSSLLYDRSIIPTNFLRGLVRWVFPYATIMQTVNYEMEGNEPEVYLNATSLDYKLVPKQDHVVLSDFFSANKQLSCMFKSCKFDQPAQSTTLAIAFFESFLFIFFGWLLYEFVDMNASVCRPFWKVLTPHYFDQSDYSFTSANYEYEREQRFIRENTQRNARQPLDMNSAQLCLREGAKRCDARARQTALDVMTQPSTGDEALITHHLHKTFVRPFEKNQRKLLGKYHRADRSVNIKVLKGELFAIAGHNGAGKSTAINTISGSIKPDKPGYMLIPTPKDKRALINNAWLDNKFSMREDMNKIRRYLGYCPQFNTNVYQELTVRQNLQFICELQNIPKEDIDRQVTQVLLQVGLLHVQNQLLSELSGGMQRRISIAVSLINPKKKLVILDEPTTGLDPQTKRVIWAVMKHTARNKRKCPIIVGSSSENQKIRLAYAEEPGVMLTSHDMNELNVISDSITIMSDGEVVAAGTALELKRKYGKGWTLSIACKSSEDSAEFTNQFIDFVQESGFSFSEDPEDEQSEIRLIDESGAVSQFAVSNYVQGKLDIIVHYVEELLAAGNYIDDYCLETTSMDEVFVTVGHLYDCANGGSSDKELTVKKMSNRSADNMILLPANASFEESEKMQNLEGGNQIEFADLGQGDNKVLSQEQIEQILSPKRSRPSTFRALMYKMSNNDKLNKAGFLSFIIIPVICIVIAWALSEKLVPWAVGKATDMKSWYGSMLDTVCGLCGVIKANGLQVDECNGFNAYGYANTCMQSVILGEKEYVPQTVWYGGDDNVFEPISLYNSEEYPQSVLVFDDAAENIKYESEPVIISEKEAGAEQLHSETIQGVLVQNTEYEYFDSVGEIKDESRKQHYESLISQYKRSLQGSTSLIDKMPIKTVAYPKIDNDNTISNQFTIAEDLIVKNGYEIYESVQDLDDYLLTILRKGIKTEIPVIRSNYTCYRRNKCLFDDDYSNTQYLQQKLAQVIPQGYIELKDDNIHIQSFMPSRTTFSYNWQYGFDYKALDSQRRLNFESQVKQLLNNDSQSRDVLRMIFSHDLHFMLSPGLNPTIEKINYFDMIYVSGASQMMDLMTRVSQALLRQKTGEDVNFRVGINIFKHKAVDYVEAGGLSIGLMYSTVFLSVASMMGIAKYGFHVVQDRQSGMRKSLYLNGVTTAQYWGSTVFYAFVVCLGLQMFILLVGAGIFEISAYKRMDVGIMLVHAIGGVFAVVSTSLLFSSFFAKTSMFSASAVIIILLSLIIVMIFNNGTEPSAFEYVLPTLSYVSMFIQFSYFGTTLRSIVDTKYFGLLIWEYAESLIMIMLAIYLDNVIPMNGYCKQPWYWPFTMLKKEEKQDQIEVIPRNEVTSNYTAEQGKGRPVDDPASNKVISTDSSVKLIPVPDSVKTITVRDQAAAHDDSRMDIDVRAERELVKQGVSDTTPIVITNLEKQFGPFMAIRDMTFHVPNINGKGCVFALLGPNGAAKTTTINIMTGLMAPTHGNVFIHERNMADRAQATEVYRNLGLCTQFDIFLPDLSVRQHLVMFAALHGVKWEEIDDVVENLAKFVCLDNVLEKKVKELSGGMKRRMNLALALIG